MANDNTIRTFTAQDIEKYHKGLLLAAERHALEKAALDDPFLADALEGYAAAGVNAQSDITDLKNKLAERTTQAKVVTLRNASSRKTSFSWLRAAAMIILVAGAGLLVYQFAFNKAGKEKEIAQSPNNNESSTSILPDTAKTSTAPLGLVDKKTDTDRIEVTDNEQAPIAPNKNLKRSDSSSSFLNMEIASSKSKAASTQPAEQKNDSLFAKRYVATATPVLEVDEKKVIPEKKGEYKNPNLDKVVADDKGKEKAERDLALNEQLKKANNGIVANRKESNAYYKYSNTFRGRVTDTNNNGLPFANVTNVQDNVGTYADARGYFNLTSTDSVLNVQVKSNGFNSNNFQLRNYTSSNLVVLQEDKSLAVQTLPPAKLNYERHSRKGNMKLEGEPEPEDGWEYYDSYLVNNLNIPDEAIRGKQSGGTSVEVSFEVNKHGEPINFKIEKSLCAKCDLEAIRLIKEGPKWKRKAKKGRTTVTISF